jgi:hypothetical protein
MINVVRGYNMFPSPGSLAAMKMGCICPPQINSMGRGNVELNEAQPGQRWVYHRDCPFHVIPMECATVGVEEHNEWVILEQPEGKRRG